VKDTALHLSRAHAEAAEGAKRYFSGFITAEDQPKSTSRKFFNRSVESVESVELPFSLGFNHRALSLMLAPSDLSLIL